MREDVDKLAEALLELCDVWHDADRRRIEALARSLIEEAGFLGVDPREHAPDRLVSLDASFDEDAPLDDEAEDLRADLAVAAALVLTGRVTP